MGKKEVERDIWAANTTNRLSVINLINSTAPFGRTVELVEITMGKNAIWKINY